jgi:putative tryptophan/tyrosine transport system substrate-binding protein
MRRRHFLSFVGMPIAAWPALAAAQRSAASPRPARVGILNYATPDYSRVAEFRNELQTLGYVEGKNLALSHVWSNGDSDRLPKLASELIADKVDLIIALGPAAWAAKRETSTVPIVIAFSGDLVGTGMVPNLFRPGGNITGFSYMSSELAGKRLELLGEAFSKSGKVAAFYNPNEPATALELRETEAAARGMGLTLLPVTARQPHEVGAAFAAASGDGADAIIMFTHGFVELNRELIIEEAARHRLPTMYGWRDFVAEGGLMSYGPDVRALVRAAAGYVVRILHGERPGDLPVQQPDTLELVVNLRTAKALGLAMPPTILARADEVIE